VTPTCTYTCSDARWPRCKAEMTGATGLTDGATPSANDISVCIYCGAVLAFNVDLTVREATREDLDDLPPKLAWQLGLAVGVIHLRLQKERHGTH
jgi:hypothetical protein